MRDILAMKAGFDWDESTTQYGTPDNPKFQLAQSNDWIKFMLDRKMKYVPGVHFTYNSGCSILLSGVLLKKTRLQTDDFAEENLFTPLGITLWQWETGPKNITNTGWGLYLLSRDMAKIGYLVLNNGKWNGKELLSKAWIDSATTPSTILNGGAYSYGFQWWMKPIEHVSGHSPTARDIRFAWGWGGQFIFLIPKYDLVVVETSGNYEQNEVKPIEFLEDYILKAIQ